MEHKDDVAGRDRALVEAVLSGRDGAFAALVERHQGLVWHLVYRMVRHPEDCRELCQEVFMRVHDKLAQFRFDSSLATWIGRVAFSICARHLQRKRLPMIEQGDADMPPVETATDDFDLAAACADQQLMGFLHDALEELPPVSRTALTLYYLEEMSVGEVSVIMEKPEGTIKNLLFRARSRLRSKLQQYLEPSNEGK